ncbi:hypothetical protein D9M70_488150 [compost metagenome]
MGLHDQPGGAEQGITDDDGDAGHDREGRQPVPPAADIGAVLDGDTLDERAESYALREGCEHRTARERPVPEIFGTPGAPAIFEGDAAEDEADDHGDNRGVECRQDRRISERKYRHQTAAAEHQPGFVAVPDRRDGIHHHVAVVLLREERKEDADAEVEAVEDDIGEHRKGDDGGPDERQIKLHDDLHECWCWRWRGRA